MEKRTTEEIARDIVAKSKSPWCDDETHVAWIKGALEEVAAQATRQEHDRITKFICSASREKMDDVIDWSRGRTAARRHQ